MEKLKVGVVGAGAIARRGHLPTLKAMPDIELVGLADIDEKGVRNVAREFSIPGCFLNYQDLIRESGSDIIDICTPPQSHLEIIKAAAEQGKHILVEKPMALSLKEALEIQRIIKDSRVKFSVIHNYRYFPSLVATKERISRGYLGQIMTMHGLALINFPGRWTRSTWLYHPGGVLYDYAPHLIDMFLWLNESPAKRVYALGGDISNGDMGFANHAEIIIEFENGSIATADISWLSGTLQLTIDIHGTGGHTYLDVRSDDFSETHGFITPFDDLRTFARKMFKITKGVLTGSYFKGALLHYRPLFADFIESIRKDQQPPVTVEQAVAVNAILEAATQSITLKRPVDLEELTGDKN